eukprot:TRINITY_DN40110_c0_g1_i1.p1 TRINITY_DN40110_c0_g1~~TRINITY_DN40110_c0_g1_i1.p1  ORF type:complete len:139 (+),score=30.71 TRINITY_DN40110_c0_g1_i1:41-457(+)
MKKLCARYLWSVLGLVSLEVKAQTVSPMPEERLPDGSVAVQAQSGLGVIRLASNDDRSTQDVKRAGESEPVQLEEVIVTATKRAQPARAIPVSMAVLEGEKLEELGVRKVKEIFALVPEIGKAVQQECRDRSRMPSSA